MPFTEISVTDAYQLLADDPSAVLIDVRTPEEWTQIGVPTLEEEISDFIHDQHRSHWLYARTCPDRRS